MKNTELNKSLEVHSPLRTGRKKLKKETSVLE